MVSEQQNQRNVQKTLSHIAENEISGHPTLGETITVCSNCGAMRTIIWFVRDRWFCTKCKNEGTAVPTYVPLSRKTNHG